MHLRQLLRSTGRTRLHARRLELRRLADLLGSISPLAVLGRGYAICRDRKGTVLRRFDAVASGDTVKVRLHLGELQCEVQEAHAPGPEEA